MKKLLEFGVLALALVSTSLGELPPNPETGSIEADVLIVGAGVAGLTAGSYLRSKGYKVAIIEARGSWGGRVNTTTLGGLNVDLGAQWLHGEQDKHFLHSAVKELNYPTVRSDYEPEKVVRTTPLPSIQYSEAFITKMYAEWAKVEKLFASKYQNIGNVDRPIAWGLNGAVNELRSKGELNILKDDTIVQYLFVTEMLTDYGGSPEKMSLWWFDSDYGWGRFEDSYVPLGMQPLLRQKFRNLWEGGEEDPFHYRRVVYKVQENSKSVTVKARVLDSSGVLLREDTFVGKTCLVTIPLGVLKDPSLVPEFLPPLSAKFKAALKMREMGRDGKIIMQFNTNFWGGSTFEFIGNIADSPFLEFINADNYLPSNLVNGRHYLIGFFGDRGADLIESSTDAEVTTMMMNTLKQMFRNTTVPDAPVNVIVTRWHTDPYARGAYSYNGVGIKLSRAFKDIARNGKRVFFAGEHCDPAQFGAMNAAYNSATKAAKSMISLKLLR